MIFLRLLIANALLVCLAAGEAVRAEVLILKSGGHIEGRLLNPDQSPRKTYEIMTRQGGRVVVDAGRVEKVINPDTLADKDVDSENDAKDGPSKPATQEEIMKRRGYRRYKGRWLSPQEIKSLERREQRDAAVRGWYAKIKQWSGRLGGAKSEEAQKAIEEINDPLAAAALADALAKDNRRAAAFLYIEALYRLNTPDAAKALALAAMKHPDEEVRLSCLDFLKRRKDPAVVDYFAAQLRHKNNVMVNRAAAALRVMDDPSAVPALIDALITVHVKKVTSGGPGQTSAAFGNTGGGGMTMGSTTKIFKIPMKNRDVLDALISITDSVNFEFDVPAWKYWLEEQNKSRKGMLRK